jgi:hypothetical protein
MNNLKFLYLTLLTTFLLTSCNSHERRVKKFIKRINAREINSASKYLWPEDHASLYVFNERFLAHDKLTTFEIKDVIADENNEKIITTIELLNAKEGLKSYFDSLGLLKENILTLTFTTRKTEESDFVSIQLPWSDCQLPPNLKKSSVQTESLNLRSGPGLGFPVQKVAKQGDDLLIDADYKNNGWRKGFEFNETGEVETLYFSSKLSDENQLSFFNLGYFATTSILLLCVIGVIVVLISIITTIFSFKALGESAGLGLALFGLLAAIIFFTYQIIENLLFELFLINLPY